MAQKPAAFLLWKNHYYNTEDLRSMTHFDYIEVSVWFVLFGRDGQYRIKS